MLVNTSPRCTYRNSTFSVRRLPLGGSVVFVNSTKFSVQPKLSVHHKIMGQEAFMCAVLKVLAVGFKNCSGLGFKSL